MKNKLGLKRKISRVDYQVSLIIAVIVTLSFVCVYFLNYQTTYQDMLNTLRERSDNIYALTEQEFNEETFDEINTREDMNKEIYHNDKVLLEYIKNATGVRYLYTAKRTDDHKFIYVLDGLSSESTDFRYPGDLIEEETISELERAYRNEVVYPNDIKNTSWGKIFVSYYPIHENDEVIGVIGIEFDAQHQYDTFKKIRIMTPIIGFIFALIAIVISVKLFRRISNPFYKDLANTDYLTDIKNRNAFELFVKNIEAKGKTELDELGFISIDLNDLKLVNDEKGHQSGDQYIQRCASVLKRFETKHHSLYRVGGDEFIFVCYQASAEELSVLCSQIINAINEYNAYHFTELSIACGYAVYDDRFDHKLTDIIERADKNMYLNKKTFKCNQQK